MRRRIDAHRSTQPPAVAAGEEERALAPGEQKARHRDRRRRLAGASDGEIAETDNRHPSALPLGVHAPGSSSAVEPRERNEQFTAAALPPECRFAHQRAIPKSADRRTERIMRNPWSAIVSS